MAPARPVDELAALTGWTGHADAGISWEAVESALGLTLPADVKELSERFPTGLFCSFVEIYAPPEAFLAEARDALELLAEQDDLPHPVHPAPGGLLPWAGTTEGHTLCWLTGDPDPDHWPVVFCDDEFERWGEYAGGAVAFLRDLMSGRFRHDLLDEHLEGCDPVFDEI
ncbi:SMI1/KNR4 family protein [Lentzea sp. NPDC092896]|uniref:SMI1/KNR4 family protein n=1 Tax=Lentzea sp. NPDC092896 TaxID=3364127 RepID=UPI0037F7EECA